MQKIGKVGLNKKPSLTQEYKNREIRINHLGYHHLMRLLNYQALPLNFLHAPIQQEGTQLTLLLSKCGSPNGCLESSNTLAPHKLVTN